MQRNLCEKADEHYEHAIVVTILTLAYVIGVVPAWLRTYTFEVKLVLICLGGGLLGQGLLVLYPNSRREIAGMVLIVALSLAFIRAF